MPDDNMADESVPAADRAEQLQSASAEPDVAAVPDHEPADDASTADALDQERPVRVTSWVDPPTIAHDVPEADALDQARAVPLDEDEDRYDAP